MTILKKIVCTAVFFAAYISSPLFAQQTTTNDSSLNTRQQKMAAIAAFTAMGDQDRLSKEVAEGLQEGLTINEIKEVMVQLYAYAGFPRSLNAITTLQKVVDERKQKGIADTDGKTASKVRFTKGKFQYGRDVLKKLTGTDATGKPQQFVPIIDTFLKEHLFADIFARDILTYKEREIVTIAALASMSGTEGQLRSHLNVGKNVGLTQAQLRSIAAIVSFKIEEQSGNTMNGLIDIAFNVEGSQHFSPIDSGFYTIGQKVKQPNFTGDVWLNTLVVGDSTYNTVSGTVTFAPRARTHWHYHPGGQILMVLEGEGLYQEKGSPIKTIKKGEVVKCTPNIPHWHGATPRGQMRHIAIGTNLQKGNVVWQEPVTDEEYNARY